MKSRANFAHFAAIEGKNVWFPRNSFHFGRFVFWSSFHWYTDRFKQGSRFLENREAYFLS
jgi:hypothetical protein